MATKEQTQSCAILENISDEYYSRDNNSQIRLLLIFKMSVTLWCCSVIFERKIVSLHFFILFYLLHRNGTEPGKGFGTCYVNTEKSWT